jgi:hypothetical protein
MNTDRSTSAKCPLRNVLFAELIKLVPDITYTQFTNTTKHDLHIYGTISQQAVVHPWHAADAHGNKNIAYKYGKVLRV